MRGIWATNAAFFIRSKTVENVFDLLKSKKSSIICWLKPLTRKKTFPSTFLLAAFYVIHSLRKLSVSVKFCRTDGNAPFYSELVISQLSHKPTLVLKYNSKTSRSN